MADRQSSTLPLSGNFSHTSVERTFVALSIYTGDTFIHEFTWVHNRHPVDLTGQIGSAVLRTAIDGEELAVFSVIVTDAENGVFVLYLSDTETAALTGSTEGVWDVQFESVAGQVRTPGFGSATISRDVTQ